MASWMSLSGLINSSAIWFKLILAFCCKSSASIKNFTVAVFLFFASLLIAHPSWGLGLTVGGNLSFRLPRTNHLSRVSCRTASACQCRKKARGCIPRGSHTFIKRPICFCLWTTTWTIYLLLDHFNSVLSWVQVISVAPNISRFLVEPLLLMITGECQPETSAVNIPPIRGLPTMCLIPGHTTTTTQQESVSNSTSSP